MKELTLDITKPLPVTGWFTNVRKPVFHLCTKTLRKGRTSLISFFHIKSNTRCNIFSSCWKTSSSFSNTKGTIHVSNIIPGSFNTSKKLLLEKSNKYIGHCVGPKGLLIDICLYMTLLKLNSTDIVVNINCIKLSSGLHGGRIFFK